MDKRQKNKQWVYRIVLLTLVSLISLLVDYKLQFRSTSLANLVVILYNAIIVLAGIWITCYLLFLQLYKDRYPLQIIKKHYLPHMKDNFVMVMYCIIGGGMLIGLDYGAFSNLTFCVVSLFSITEILLKIYNTNKSLMVNTYIDDFTQKLKDSLGNSSNIRTEETLKDIRHILDESIIKEEYYVAQNIVANIGEIFRSFLENSIKINQTETSETVKKSFDDIIDINIELLEMCQKIESENLVDKIISQQNKNLKFCINTAQRDWFESYLEKINCFMFKYQKQDNARYIDKIYRIYFSSYRALVDAKKTDWLKFMLNEIESVVGSLSFIVENINLSQYCMFVSQIVSYNIEQNYSDLDEFVHDKIRTMIEFVFREQSTFDSVKIYFALLFNAFLKESIKKAIDFCDFLFAQICNNNSSSIAFYDFKIYCIVALTEKDSERIYVENIYQFHLKLCENVINSSNKDELTFTVPNFEKLIFTNEYNTEKVDKLADDIKRLFHYAIIRENVFAFFSLFKMLNSLMRKTEIRHKHIQEKVFSIYSGLMVRTSLLPNKQFLEITFDMTEEMLHEIDKNNLVSSGLAEFIINKISYLAKNASKDMSQLVFKTINLLFSFLDKDDPMFFITKSSDRKKEVYKAMFNIGMSCIENNNEEGLRKASNAMGWFIKNSIDDGTVAHTNYLIERASELYNVSKKMEISSKTQTFILTLFTTMGTYCCKDLRLKSFLKGILHVIKDTDVSIVETAVRLRTSENDMWNDMFENRTAELTRKFLREFTKVLQN